MILATYYTPSHEAMCREFVLNRASAAGFRETWIGTGEQTVENGHYNAVGFDLVCIDRLRWLSELSLGSRVCFVDADCLIMPGLAEWCSSRLERCPPDTMSFGDDFSQLCMGTIVWQQTTATRRWMNMIADLAWIFGTHDQEAMNAILKASKRIPLHLRVLPHSIFCNYRFTDKSNINWTDQPLEIPDSTLCWHANFCKGIQNKTRMLSNVLDKLSTGVQS